MGQIATLTLFRFDRLSARIWAFGQMQFAHSALSKVSGQTFYKLMGSGREYFSPWPDWSVYALLQVWNSESAARTFLEINPKYGQYVRQASERWVLFLQNTSARGTWDGKEPFVGTGGPQRSDQPCTLVLTRATIKNKHLLRFWRYVPDSQQGLYDQPGLIYTKGVGEWPVKNMATLSVWEGEEGIRQFAYRNRGHTHAVRLTKEYDWYSEELFSRFSIIGSEGSWGGVEARLSHRV